MDLQMYPAESVKATQCEATQYEGYILLQLHSMRATQYDS
jgi:hypothetical protein